MNKEDFAYIGCRLLALYWAVEAIYSISSFAASWATWQTNVVDFPPEMAAVVYYNLVPLVLYILVASILWFGAARIVHFLLPAKGVKTEGGTITLLQAQSVAFAAVGVLILLSALPEMGGVLYKIHLMKEMDRQALWPFDTQAQVFELSIRLLLGMFLLFGSWGLSGILIRIRQLGTK